MYEIFLRYYCTGGVDVICVELGNDRIGVSRYLVVNV